MQTILNLDLNLNPVGPMVSAKNEVVMKVNVKLRFLVSIAGFEEADRT